MARSYRKFTVEIQEGDGNYYVQVSDTTNGHNPLTLSVRPEVARDETEALDRIICGAMIAALRYNR
jgi:hypothetical protein